MRELKFRQPIFGGNDLSFQSWHYWGFVDDDKFYGVVAPLDIAKETSQQYTGLKDKNGKELYEGDMLSVDGRNSGLPVVVIYEDGAFMGAYTDSTFKYPLNSVELHLQKTEVIGNVYENPELLTPENK